MGLMHLCPTGSLKDQQICFSFQRNLTVSDTWWRTTWLAVHQKDLKTLTCMHMFCGCKPKPHKKKCKKNQSGIRYEERNINGPKRSLFATNVILLKLHHHVMFDGVALSSNECDPSTIWMLFLPIRQPLRIASVVTLFSRHGCLRFSETERQTETTCCRLSEILNLRVVHFSVTNRMWLTYHLMHDSDLFTLQSTQSIYLRSLTRMSTRVPEDHW